MTDERLTPAVENYLKAIHSLGGADTTVSPVDIADRLRVRAPSVTGMLKRLAEAGWISYVSGHGARLTESGLAEARRVIRRHRLVELFLTRVLGLLERGGRRGRGAGARHLAAAGAGPGGVPARAAGGPARPPHPDAR